MIAALITFSLGAVSVKLSPLLAGGGAVVTAFILWLREPMHGLLNRIDANEMSAFLRLLLISIVVLPAMPDVGLGPYQVINPRHIWWMVVLISGLGFIGYVSVKALGERAGVGLLALAGGLASSTAGDTVAVSVVKSWWPGISLCGWRRNGMVRHGHAYSIDCCCHPPGAVADVMAANGRNAHGNTYGCWRLAMAPAIQDRSQAGVTEPSGPEVCDCVCGGSDACARPARVSHRRPGAKVAFSGVATIAGAVDADRG